MKITKKINLWLETHGSSPTYSGCLLAGIAISFFGAATNTMAGWLYVLSGVIVALLGLGAILPIRSLKNLKIKRYLISPVSAGDKLTVTLEIKNTGNKPQTFLQVKDLLPYNLASAKVEAVELIPPKSSYLWTYYPTTSRRGVYLWEKFQLRSGSPLGLFWCRRFRYVPAKAIVYPTVLPLKKCPLIDTIGQEDSISPISNHRYQAATQGITKALRPYRYGDSTRLIHWRSSAKLGELQIRELEVITGGQEVIICLDSAINWQEDEFEQAVIAAASLYFYASRQQYQVKLWTAATGLLHGNRVVLEALAATRYNELIKGEIPQLPLIWLTNNNCQINKLPRGSRWALFMAANETRKPLNLAESYKGLVINLEKPLQQQLSALIQ